MKNNFKIKSTNQNSKRSLIAAILLFIFMLSLCSVAYASSYSTTVKFKNPYAGSMRSFNGNNIKYSATMSSSAKNDKGTYTIYLQKKSGIWAFDVGTPKKLARVGYGTAKWPDVGSGDYRLYFDKSSDGVTLSSNNVTIANY